MAAALRPSSDNAAGKRHVDATTLKVQHYDGKSK